MSPDSSGRTTIRSSAMPTAQCCWYVIDQRMANAWLSASGLQRPWLSEHVDENTRLSPPHPSRTYRIRQNKRRQHTCLQPAQPFPTQEHTGRSLDTCQCSLGRECGRVTIAFSPRLHSSDGSPKEEHCLHRNGRSSSCNTFAELACGPIPTSDIGVLGVKKSARSWTSYAHWGWASALSWHHSR